MDLKRIRHRLTPTGAADRTIREAFGDAFDTEHGKQYRRTRQRFQRAQRTRDLFRVLFYASLVTSVVTALGLPQLRIIQTLHSYIGTTVIFVLFLAASYLTAIRRERYHTQRSIFIADATVRQRKN